METALIEILKGVPVAAVLFYFAVQFRKDSGEAQARYEKLVDKVMDVNDQRSAHLAGVISGYMKILERVEVKLNEKH